MERTLVLLKPDAVQRGLVGTILARFEAKGLELVGMKLRVFDRPHLEKHYEEHREKPFFTSLVDFMSSAPTVALVLQGKDAVEVVRRLVGKTNGRESAPGTIRGDFGMSFSTNLVHASDGPESAEREVSHWFGGDELFEWEPCDRDWRYDVAEELS